VSDRRLPGSDQRALLRPAIPAGSSPQVLADDLVPALLTDLAPGAQVVDLGCGRGDSVDLFRAVDPAVRWIGVDLPSSAEVDERTRDDAEFRTFDGLRLPFADASVDLVFSKQVLEHVERPHELVADVARVLRPGGRFAGSTSQLEPYHSRSTGNWTPYGLQRLFAQAGLEAELFVPGIDALTLLARALSGGRAFNRWWSRRSPLNTLVDGVGRVLGWDAEDRNTVKLQFAGQFAFIARRPATAPPHRPPAR
jgi:SAM-dependent methyltransferase